MLHIGIDDTDSPKGMCTTFLAYKIARLLKRQDAEFLDFPCLVRFNPNIPWKTRGNGAVMLKVRTQNTARVKSQIQNMVARYSDVENGANPGLAFYEGESIPGDFSGFSDLALWQLIRRNDAKKFAIKHGLDFFYRGNGQGLVGAIGAIGYRFDDHTLELLSYRKRANFGKRRNISARSVQLLHEKTAPGTFSSYDEVKRRVLVSPHGPDPVFYGIRGEDVESLLSAARLIRTPERPDGYMIFKSNQGTNDHLKNMLDAATMRPFASGKLAGTVKTMPRTAKGGHVFFTIHGGCEFGCAVYRPTGMTNIAMQLVPGDRICIGGGVRKASKNFSRVLNVEFLDVLKLKENIVSSNPFCKTCSKSMKSKGVGQGYRCVKCGKRSPGPHTRSIPRGIKERLYLPVVSAHRHLTRPMQRLKRRNTESEFSESLSWIGVYE